ncbi:MAG: YidC/Oxa1 family membrane protein insertase [Chloroflexota bacterium]|nr:YidC/Oxa1 family membrane protein insertase [Chloroflexota bacterium]
MQRAANRPQIDAKQLRKSILTWVIVGAVILGGFQIGWGVIWREGLIRPMLNLLLFLYAHLGESFVVAIAGLTVGLRLITFPLQIRQIRTSKKTAALQPKLSKLQEKYGGDKERLLQEQQKLYKEAGVNPLGGCLPTLIQFPIWIALYQSINSILADTPLELMNLGKNVYASFDVIAKIVPLQSTFLWLDLAKPDPTPFVLPVLVAGTMWLQQKMMTPASSDPQQASMNQTMQFMMPLMFGYFTMQFASGLAIYFVISNIVGIAMQWVIEKIEGPAMPDAEDEA